MRKHIIFAVSTLLLVAVSPFAAAKTVYLSSTGSDANNGSAVAQAVKTLSMSLTLAGDNDEVRVLDFIDLSQEPYKAGSLNDINVNGTSVYTTGGRTYNTWNVTASQGVKLLNRKIIIRIEASAFIGNKATGSHGGAFILTTASKIPRWK